MSNPLSEQELRPVPFGDYDALLKGERVLTGDEKESLEMWAVRSLAMSIRRPFHVDPIVVCSLLEELAALARERDELRAVVEKLERVLRLVQYADELGGSVRIRTSRGDREGQWLNAMADAMEAVDAALAAAGSPAGSPPRQEKH
jgi:hypothetical protein